MRCLQLPVVLAAISLTLAHDHHAPASPSPGDQYDVYSIDKTLYTEVRACPAVKSGQTIIHDILNCLFKGIVPYRPSQRLLENSLKTIIAIALMLWLGGKGARNAVDSSRCRHRAGDQCVGLAGAATCGASGIRPALRPTSTSNSDQDTEGRGEDAAGCWGRVRILGMKINFS